MLPPEFNRMYSILASFLGEAKNGFDGNTTQLQFGCPHCIEKYGEKEKSKYNLEVNFFAYNCWKCNAEDDNMHGPILKLIKIYGNDELYREYKNCIESLKESKLYSLNFLKDTKIDIFKTDDLILPKTYKPFKKDKFYPSLAFEYLQKRGITWDIINNFNIGYTTYCKEEKMASNRIIIPSYDKFGELNYWTGRDYRNISKQKYFNPKVERKELIFNEEKVQWDADITLVEGPFDHLVVPNSIPLLGKTINKDFRLYWELFKKAKANINIFLDGDAFETVLNVYKTLNHDNLYGRIRYIPVNAENDPSSLFQNGGYKEIAKHLMNAQKIKEIYLF